MAVSARTKVPVKWGKAQEILEEIQIGRRFVWGDLKPHQQSTLALTMAMMIKDQVAKQKVCVLRTRTDRSGLCDEFARHLSCKKKDNVGIDMGHYDPNTGKVFAAERVFREGATVIFVSHETPEPIIRVAICRELQEKNIDKIFFISVISAHGGEMVLSIL